MRAEPRFRQSLRHRGGVAAHHGFALTDPQLICDHDVSGLERIVESPAEAEDGDRGGIAGCGGSSRHARAPGAEARDHHIRAGRTPPGGMSFDAQGSEQQQAAHANKSQRPIAITGKMSRYRW